MSDYVVPLRRHWLALLLCLLLGLGLAVAFLELAPRKYTADAFVLVTAIPSGDASSTSSKAGTINLDTESQLVTSTQTLDAVAKSLHLSADAASQLPNDVTVTVPPNTEILDISYVDPTPGGAVKGSLAFANAYLAQRQATGQAYLAAQDKTLQAQIGALNAQLGPLVSSAATLSPTSEARARADAQINSLDGQLATLTNQDNQVKSQNVQPGEIVTQPTTPDSPSFPNTLITLAAGLVLGLLLGIGVAAVRHRSDRRIHTPEDLIRKTHVPVATVLTTRPAPREVTLLPSGSADGRGFARLRNLVVTGLEDTGGKVVLVAGVRHGSGQVAANLAASLAGAGEDVVLLCADVYASTAEGLLDAPRQAGLAEVVSGEADLDAVLRPTARISSLRVLGPGLDAERAEAALQTTGARRLVQQLLTRASYVVIEVPATATSPDAQTLAHDASLSVLVVEQGEATDAEVVDACALLESMHAPVLGAALVRYGKAKRAGKPNATAPSQRPAAGSAASDEPVQQDAQDAQPAEDVQPVEGAPPVRTVRDTQEMTVVHDVRDTPSVRETQEIQAVHNSKDAQKRDAPDAEAEQPREAGAELPELLPPATRGSTAR